MFSPKPFLRTVFFLFLLTCLLAGLVGFAQVKVDAAPQFVYPATSIVISEFRFRGPTGGNDEFIELYNPTLAPIDISGWLIRGSNNAGVNSTRATIPVATILQAGQYYLVAHTGYSGLIPADLNYATGITDDGGVALTLADSITIIDQVGLSAGSIYKEGVIPATFWTTNLNQSYERRIGSVNGSCQDDGNNVTDFTIITPSDPQNVGTIIPCGIPTATSIPVIEVAINEVAWAGTRASSDDEWIELYNPSGTVTADISGWRLVTASGSLDITFPPGTTIAPNGYFLIERREAATNIPANLITSYPWALNDGGDVLRLRKPDGTIVDTANSNGGAWPTVSPSPNFPTMERTIVAPDSDFTWLTFSGTIFNAKDATLVNDIYGTPGVANTQLGSTPTFTPTPTLTPTSTATATLTPTNTATVTLTSTRTLTPTITSTALPAASSVVISEFRTIGPSGANDEFIELYNPTNGSISIAGWILKRSSACGVTVSTVVSIPSGVTLAAGKHYLIGGTTYSNTAITPDLQNQALTISDQGGIALFQADGVTMVDQVGLCSQTLYREGTAINPVVQNANQSWDRKAAPGGQCSDSNNNAQDFFFRRPSDPQNLASAVTRCGNATPTPTITPTRTVTPRATRTNTPQPPPPPPPQPLVAISEFVPRPGRDWNNDGVINTGDEFIELINYGIISVTLSGYTLDDEANLGSSPFSLPAVTLQPGERRVFYGKETGLLLSDGGDGVRLLKPTGQLADAYNYNVVRNPDQSYCRLPDDGGADLWKENCFPTPGLKNSQAGFAPIGGGTVEEPLCPIADTVPTEFTLAECPSFGNMFSRQYWDQGGWLDAFILPNDGQWDVFVE